MEQLNFGQAKSLTNQVTRRTTTKPIVSATPTAGNCRISAVGGDIIGTDYDQIQSEEGQYIDVRVFGSGDDKRVFIGVVPEGATEDVRGAKLAQPQEGSNLMFSNKNIYHTLDGHPSSTDEDKTYNVHWMVSKEEVPYTDDDGNEWSFYELTFDEKVGSLRGSADTSEEAKEEETAEVDFD